MRVLRIRSLVAATIFQCVMASRACVLANREIISRALGTAILRRAARHHPFCTALCEIGLCGRIRLYSVQLNASHHALFTIVHNGIPFGVVFYERAFRRRVPRIALLPRQCIPFVCHTHSSTHLRHSRQGCVSRTQRVRPLTMRDRNDPPCKEKVNF